MAEFWGIKKLYSSQNVLSGARIEMCTCFRSNLGKSAHGLRS